MVLEAGCVVWSIRRLRHYLFSVLFLIYTDRECLNQVKKNVKANPASNAGWSSFQSTTIVAHTDEDEKTPTLTFSPDYHSLYCIGHFGLIRFNGT